MDEPNLNIQEQIAAVAARLQAQRTGHKPGAVKVVFSDDTLVITFQEALTPAETALTKSRDGAAQVQEFHRQLFAASSAEMREEILRITGRRVREAAGEVEMAPGVVVQTFTTGAMVQVFSLDPNDRSTPPRHE